ncbi:MAG: bifunctional riboflavin kinase/FAD synthetase, partial [Actinomycetota bacterium]|nr:bifunctional riboflavin kinase/FAD synthetase [Actinomycetota bacterium]
MQVWSGLGEVPGDLGRCVVTLGNFDGVHRGHRAVLGQLVAQALARGESSVAVTFDPHPVAVLFPDRAPLAITSLDQRLTLMASTGLDAVLVIEFTTQFAHLTPEAFVSQVFVDALHASTVIVGEDTRFGWRNSGNVDTLRELGVSDGFEVVTLADLGEGQRWSSTMARNQLTEGDVEAV